MTVKLLRDGMFAAQDKIDAAPDNEVREGAAFVDEYKSHPDLLRFRKIHDPQKLSNDISDLFLVKEQYQAVEGFAPAKASSITEDKIAQLLMRGGNISEL